MKWPSTSLKAISKKYWFAIEKSMVRTVFGTMISISSSFSLTRGKSMCLTNGFRSTLLRGQHVFEPMLTFNVKFVACFTSRWSTNWKYLSQWTWDNGTRKNLPLGTPFLVHVNGWKKFFCQSNFLSFAIHLFVSFCYTNAVFLSTNFTYIQLIF